MKQEHGSPTDSFHHTPGLDFSSLRPNSAWYCYWTRSALLTALQEAEGMDLARSDIDFVEQVTEIHQQSHILEIGCAWGRHSLELASRGYTRVTSLDVCARLATLAQERAMNVGYTLDIQALDYLDYHTSVPFDIILSLYDRSCLGQPDEEQDRQSLEHLTHLLRPEGFLVFGIGDWPVELPVSSRSWQEVEHGFELYEVLVDTQSKKCIHRTLVLGSNGKRESYALTRIHYSLFEVQALLETAGFQLLSSYHAFDASRPYGTESEGLVVVAQRRSAKKNLTA